MTITSESSKWGWNFDMETKRWSACRYMEGNGFDSLEFDEETSKELESKLLDCCGTRPKVKEVYSKNLNFQFKK